jgi:hypothetical protein
MQSSEIDRGSVHRAIDGEVAALLGVGGGEAYRLPRIGVRALMLAMLEDAVRAYLGVDRRGREEAEAWIDSARHRWVFSFATVCETLGLEPVAVRGALRRMRTRAIPLQALRFGKSRPNARQANLRIVAPRVRRRRRAAATFNGPELSLDQTALLG